MQSKAPFMKMLEQAPNAAPAVATKEKEMPKHHKRRHESQHGRKAKPRGGY